MERVFEIHVTTTPEGCASRLKDISQRELGYASAAVMDVVERGEAFRVTRHGVVVGAVRPVVAGGFVARSTLKAALASLPPVDVASLRSVADAVSVGRAGRASDGTRLASCAISHGPRGGRSLP